MRPGRPSLPSPPAGDVDPPSPPLNIFKSVLTKFRDASGHAAAATRDVLGSCSETSGAQQERFWGRARSNRDRGTGADLVLHFALRSGDRLR